MSEQQFIDQPMPPVLLEPGLRLVSIGKTGDGQMWMKFHNFSSGRVRAVVVYVAAKVFHYHYAVRDRDTGTIIGYQGPHGDPTRDESFIYGDPQVFE